MTEAREVGEPLGYEEVRLMHGVQMAYLLRERGRGEEAGDIVREGARQYDLPVWQAALANGLCEIQGGTLVANAREVLGRLEAAGLDALPRDGTYPLALTFLATTYAYLRDRRGARRLLPVIQACRNRHPVIAGNATYWGSMNYHIGLVQATVGNHTAAIDSFHLAYEDNERVQSPLWRAFTLVAHAQTLRVHDSRGAEKGATQCLDEASSIAARYGYGRVQKHIDGTGPTLVSAEPLSP
jgi:hypothetical protein